MKRKTKISLFIGFGLFMLFSLSSCSLIDEYILNHDHVWSDYYSTDDEKHWIECEYPFCKEVKEVQYHISFDENACEIKPFCNVCNEFYGQPKEHKYVICDGDSKFYSGEINKNGVPLFYYSCECGEVSSTAKEYYGHFIYEKPSTPSTCTEPGTLQHYTCYHCYGRQYSDKNGNNIVSSSELIIPPLGHDIDENIKYNEEEHYYICRRCDEPCKNASHVFDSYSFSLNKNLSYGETYSIFDIDVTKLCFCGYSEISSGDINLHIQDHILGYGNNQISVSYDNISTIIDYNPSVASNNHNDWKYGSNGQRFVIEGVVTEISQNPDNKAFTILDSEGYGYLIKEPITVNENLSLGDVVNVVGKRNYSKSEQYISQVEYMILQDNNYDKLPDEYFVNVTNEIGYISNSKFNERYIYVPIIIDNAYLNYNNWDNVDFNINGYNKKLNYAHQYLTEQNKLKNRYYVFDYRYTSIKGLYFLNYGNYSVYALNDVETFNYNDPIYEGDLYSKDSSYLGDMLNWVYSLCEESEYELPKPLFASSYYYDVGWGEGITIVDNKIYTDSVEDYNSYSYSLYIEMVYDSTMTYRYDIYGNVESKENYAFNLFSNAYDSIFDSETSYELISADNLKRANFTSYEYKINNSYDSNGYYHYPTVTISNDIINIRPINGYKVINEIELRIYFDNGESCSRIFKITTRDYNYYVAGYNIDFSNLTSNIQFYGPNNETQLGMDDFCKRYDSNIEVCSSGSLYLTNPYGFIENNIEIYFDTYLTYYMEYVGTEYIITIADYYGNGNYSNYLYNWQNFESEYGIIHTITIRNISMHNVRINYSYFSFNCLR